MTLKIVSSKLAKFAKKLISDKKYRDSSNMFICESTKVIKNIISQGYKLNYLLITRDSKYLNDFKSLPNAWLISNQILRSISLLKNSDGTIAIFEKKINKIQIKPDGKYLVLNKIQNPGNLGTIIRTACAFDIDGIYITNDSVDLFHPETIRSAMGYIGITLIAIYYNYFDVISLLQKNHIKVYATSLNEKSTDVNKVKLTKGMAVVFGNEGNGLNHKEIRVCDKSIYINTNPKVESLNVAVATGIILSKIN